LIPKKLNIVILNILRSSAPSLFNFGIAVLGVQYCGATNWGELVSIMIVLFIFSFTSNWGNQEYLIRAYSRNPAGINTLFYSSLVTRSVFLSLSLILLIFYPINISLPAIALIVIQFIYNSFNSLIVYHQKFKQQLVAEFLGFLIILSAVIFVKSFSVFFFLTVYLFSLFVKSFVMILVLKPFPKRGVMRFDKTNIIAALPFFLIGLSGWVHSKVDIYVVDYFLTPADLAQYQILITAYMMLGGISAFILHPFSKHIYRINQLALTKIRKLLVLVGVPIVFVGSAMVWFFLNTYTVVRFDMEIYIVMTFASLPPFLFIADIFSCYKLHQEMKVMWINFFGAAIIFILAIVLIPTYGIFGATLGICTTNWLTLILYKTNKINFTGLKTQQQSS